ncbi:MAG TPA: HAD-IC family P-type ATPase, partial [Thermoplasmata archaeon]|nr:HAD-IC family P-type ATPase [Thermoplasmata archaeon]
RGSDALERAARIDLVVTDKTGTITRGHPEVVEISAGSGRTAGEVLELAFALESGSTHPLAKAVQKWAQERGSRLRPAEELRAEPGLGLTGVVEGRAVSVRRLEIDPAPAAPSNPFSAALRRVRENGWTASWVSVGGDPVGLIAFSDDADPSVPSAIRRLRADGIGIVMATGDLREAADRTARAVGIPTVQARLSPADKVALVRRLQSEGHRVAFVGDGINDAPSLSAADLGIAVGTGTEIAREAGQVLLVRPGFEGVAEALSIGRRTVAKVRQNLLWAIGYNLVLLPIAAGALVPVLGFAIYQVLPITGALAMGLSSTLVVLNSLTLRGGGPKATDGFPRLGRPIPS